MKIGEGIQKLLIVSCFKSNLILIGLYGLVLFGCTDTSCNFGGYFDSILFIPRGRSQGVGSTLLVIVILLLFVFLFSMAVCLTVALSYGYIAHKILKLLKFSSSLSYVISGSLPGVLLIALAPEFKSDLSIFSGTIAIIFGMLTFWFFHKEYYKSAVAS